jgi:ornithine carbamoyltransferase
VNNNSPKEFPVAATLFQTVSPAAAADLRHDLDLTTEQLERLLELTQQLKQSRQRYTSSLKGRSIALLFEKPSLRTKMTFELAIQQLGGAAVSQVGIIGDREPLKDIARNLDRWTDAIVARTFSQQTIDDLAHWSRVPVINALSDVYHPCQALADLFTLKEHFGRLKGLKVAYLGDGNNVAHSLMLGCARLGINFSVGTPEGYEPKPEIVAQAHEFAKGSGAQIELTENPLEAVIAANAVYTDVWASMGQESEAAQRRSVFAEYQVNETLMKEARRDAIFMHCLPAKRGQEVTDAVIESQQSAVFDQAENRLHTQKALLLTLLQ